jgi:hypothetical protein
MADLLWTWREHPILSILGLLVCGAFGGVPCFVALEIARDKLGGPPRSVATALVVLLGLLSGVMVQTALFHPGHPIAAWVLAGAGEPTVTVLYESVARRGPTNCRLRGASLASGAVVWRSPDVSEACRIVHRGNTVLWLEAGGYAMRPLAFDLRTGEIRADAARAAARASPEAPAIEIRGGVGDALAVRTQDGGPAWIVPDGSLTRVRPAGESPAPPLAWQPTEVPGLQRAEAATTACGTFVRSMSTAFGEGKARLTGPGGWQRAWAEIAGAEDAELLAVEAVAGACLFVTSADRGRLVWLDPASGELVRSVALR